MDFLPVPLCSLTIGMEKTDYWIDSVISFNKMNLYKENRDKLRKMSHDLK